MDCSMPGLPVHHQLMEFTQTPSHWFGDAIQPSHPLSSPSPPALNLPQHQSLLKWVSSSNQVAKVLEFQLQHQSFQWILRTHFFQDGLVGSPCTPRDSQESSSVPQIQSNPRADLLQNGLVGSNYSPRDFQESSPTPQIKSINSSVLSFLHSPTLTSIHDHRKNHSLD